MTCVPEAGRIRRFGGYCESQPQAGFGSGCGSVRETGPDLTLSYARLQPGRKTHLNVPVRAEHGSACSGAFEIQIQPAAAHQLYTQISGGKKCFEKCCSFCWYFW
jgi:hypothetical protein